MRAALLAVWAVSACLVVWYLWHESRRPVTATDVRCDHIDQELDAVAESRRRHPAGAGLTSRVRPVVPEDQPVVMAHIARRAEELRRAGGAS